MDEFDLAVTDDIAEPKEGPKPFLLSMAHHLIRSLLMRADEDLSLLVVVQSKKAKEAICEVIFRMNSMSYDNRRESIFIAKSGGTAYRKAMVMTDTQDHSLFIDALNNGNDTRCTKIIVQGELRKGSALAELAAKREAECFHLI